MYRKNLIVKRRPTKAKNKISFIASTDSADRYGDVINQEGWNLDAYRRNPVVLLNHNANALPIGKGTVELKNGQLVIDVEFDKEDELAQKVERKARAGFLNAVSVGFNPIEQVSRAELPKDHPAYVERGGGNYFNKSELLEVSVVTIPANSEATTMSAKNIDRLTIRDLIVEEIKHILEVEQMEDGKYRVTFAGEMEEMEEEEIEEEAYNKEEDEEEKAMDKEEEEERAMHDEEEEEERAMHDEEDDEDKKDKGFLTNDERQLLYLILKSRR